MKLLSKAALRISGTAAGLAFAVGYAAVQENLYRKMEDQLRIVATCPYSADFSSPEVYWFSEELKRDEAGYLAQRFLDTTDAWQERLCFYGSRKAASDYLESHPTFLGSGIKE